jgi:hypothetical protein
MLDDHLNNEAVQSDVTRSANNNFVTPNANRKRCVKMSDKFDSSIRKTLVRDST